MPLSARIARAILAGAILERTILERTILERTIVERAILEMAVLESGAEGGTFMCRRGMPLLLREVGIALGGVCIAVGHRCGGLVQGGFEGNDVTDGREDLVADGHLVIRRGRDLLDHLYAQPAGGVALSL